MKRRVSNRSQSLIAQLRTPGRRQLAWAGHPEGVFRETSEEGDGRGPSHPIDESEQFSARARVCRAAFPALRLGLSELEALLGRPEPSASDTAGNGDHDAILSASAVAAKLRILNDSSGEKLIDKLLVWFMGCRKRFGSSGLVSGQIGPICVIQHPCCLNHRLMDHRKTSGSDVGTGICESAATRLG
jgi:hypothetical protein